MLGAVTVDLGGSGTLGAGLGRGLALLDLGVLSLMDIAILAVGTGLVFATGAFLGYGFTTGGGRQIRGVLRRIGCHQG